MMTGLPLVPPSLYAHSISPTLTRLVCIPAQALSCCKTLWILIAGAAVVVLGKLNTEIEANAIDDESKICLKVRFISFTRFSCYCWVMLLDNMFKFLF